jgi:hypothetical protein
MRYLWLRDNLPFQAVDALTYTVTAADAGHTLRFLAGGYKTFYQELGLSSESIAIPAAVPVVVPITTVTDVAATLSGSKPTITGTAKVGKTLKAKPGMWTAGTVLSYRWYANGKAIKKATKATLKLVASIRGKKITVTVTGAKSGYTTLAKASKATKAVKK